MSEFQIIDVPGHGRVEFPVSMSDADIAAAIQRTIQQQPARMNPTIAAQGDKYRENMTPPESVTDPRMPAYRNAQRGAETLDVLGGLAGMGLGATLKPGAEAMKWGARRLMQSALKPNPAEGIAKADRAVQTMLDEGLNVTRGGVQTLRERGSRLNDEVQNIVNASPATIPKWLPATRVQGEMTRLQQNNPLPSSERAGLDAVYNEYMANAHIPQNIPLDAAQRYKQNLYSGLKKAYGNLSTGEEAGRKALARGLRQDIETRVPEVVPLNARASDIWNALNIAERRSLVAGNKDPISFAPLAASPVGMGGFLANRSELVKSLLARGLYNSQRAPGAIAGGAAGYYMGQEEQ